MFVVVVKLFVMVVVLVVMVVAGVVVEVVVIVIVTGMVIAWWEDAKVRDCFPTLTSFVLEIIRLLPIRAEIFCKFLDIPWTIPWNSLEFPGTFPGIPWNIPWNSLDSLEFPG